jgi:hypothetical protein
VPHATVLIY